MSDDDLMLPVVPRPKTWTERAFVFAAYLVYRERRSEGDSPADAWAHATDLLDHALLRPVMRAEARTGTEPADAWRDQMNRTLDELGDLPGGF